MHRRVWHFLYCIIVSLLLAACARPQPTISPLSPLPMPTPNELHFSIKGPLVAGDTIVEGTGPVGVGVILVDVTLMARRLGDGIIQSDGTFRIKVDPPLVAEHTIGIQVGMQPGQEIPPDYLDQLQPYAGEHAKDLPFIGVLWDTAPVYSTRP